MKTSNIILALVVAGTFTLAGNSFAAGSNKNLQYRSTVEATKGLSVQESTGAKHMSKYARDQEEKLGIGSTTLPTVEQPSTPKNFRNIK